MRTIKEDISTILNKYTHKGFADFNDLSFIPEDEFDELAEDLTRYVKQFMVA